MKPTTTSLDIAAYLAGRVARLEARLAKAKAADRRFFWIRLGVLVAAAAGLAVAYSLAANRYLLPVLLVSVVVFIGVVIAHRRVLRLIDDENALLAQARAQQARLDLDWMRLPPAVFALGEDTSPLERDLDLVGERSLHRLLDLSVSRGGSRRLRDWLSRPAADLAERLPLRQSLVRELTGLTGFRERMALAGAQVFGGSGKPGSPAPARFDGQALQDWLERRVSSASLFTPLLILTPLAVVDLALFLLFAFHVLPAWWLLSLTVYGGIYFAVYGSFKDLFSQASHLQNRLEQFKAIASFLEKYRYPAGSALATLCRDYTDPQERPSRYLRGIGRVTAAAGLQNNGLLWLPLNILMPWDLYFGWRLEQYKRALRARLPRWLDAWYELEAAHSLANFAFLYPDYAYPTVHNATDGQPAFTAAGLGHPLIPQAVRVVNDFSLEQVGDLALITGSNMAGKSTFLRTVGINLCLAYAGAPVAAASLRTRFFRLYPCIQVADSLADGISYFYAEVRRLRGLLDALAADDPRPVLFLIDEIFRGTNNREREAGSRAFVRALAGGRGVGLISTHDLELAQLSTEIPQMALYHFRERVEADRLVFEYLLRPGPSQTTNALLIMRQEGLPVD